MNAQEKLERIKARCQELLALAEKRTPGSWRRAGELATHVIGDYSRNNGGMICDLPDSSPDCDQYGPNASFIASCAGPAEAGWRATIAAIDGLLEIAGSEISADPYEACNHPSEAQAALNAILTAWPDELLLG